MIIDRLTLTHQSHAFRDGAYVMAHVTQTRLESRVLILEGADGVVGLGEVARMPTVDPETAKALEDACLSEAPDLAMADLPGVARSWRSKDPCLHGLGFALETAHLDWAARRAGLPLHAMLGGRAAPSVPEYLSLSCAGAEDMAAEFYAKDRGEPVVQIKLGVGGTGDDIDRVTAMLDALGPDRLVLADFNGVRSIDDALEVIGGVDDPRVVWEEPCADYADARAVMARTNAPVQLDQCLRSLVDIAHAASEGAAHSIAIKPAKLGGLSVAAAARDICVAAGMRFRIDGPWCGPIAASAIVHLALTAPPELLICGCDLRQPLEHDPALGGIVQLDDGRIGVLEAPGHGARFVA